MYLPFILPKTEMRDLHCFCITHTMDQKFAGKIAGSWCSMVFMEGYGRTNNQN